MEAFDLAVRAAPVGPGLDVLDLVLAEELAEAAALGVDPGVVGHQSRCGDAVLSVPGERAFGEGHDGGVALVVVELDVGQARVVVDDRVGVFVPVAALLSACVEVRSPVSAWPGRAKRA